MAVTIYHNPKCGTSRNTLALIRHAGIEPAIIEYLKQPPSPAQLAAFAQASGLGVRGLLREKGTPYAELDSTIPSGPTTSCSRSCSSTPSSSTGRSS
jgi:arsenate reductase